MKDRKTVFAFIAEMASTWELDPLNLAITQDKRDFSRPRQPFQVSKLPVDLNQADDKKENSERIITLAPVEIIGYKNPISQFEQIFGINPPTGKISPLLIQKAKAAETLIGNAINTSVSGMIFNVNTNQFATTPEDVSNALSLINENKQK